MSPVADFITLGDYIFQQIQASGVRTVFGVPGDFNLALLEHIYSTDLKWVGNCNELNAAYAADGYARMAGLGVVITTFGVGELSALNGIAGAYAEYVPVLHIVGTTSTTVKASGQHIHHLTTPASLRGVSDHYTYEKLVEPFSCCTESLADPLCAAQQVSRVLSEIKKHSRPGYLFVPCDLVELPVAPSVAPVVTNPGDLATETASRILAKLYEAANPCIIADILTDRFGLTETLREFVSKSEIYNFSSHMGKGILDESQPWYVGTYNGDESNVKVMSLVESSDLVIHVGAYPNEINSGHESFSLKSVVSLTQEFVEFDGEAFEVSFEQVLPKMVEMLDDSRVASKSPVDKVAYNSPTPISTAHVSQTDLFFSVQSHVRPNDVIVCETGSFMFAVPDLILPQNARVIGQHFFLSIGYALPAALGVGKAIQDLGLQSRLILIEGDGSAQMTIQEFGNYVQEGITPTVLLLNNSGYTVERVINGPTRSYNDIVPHWQWCNIFQTLGDVEGKSASYRVESAKDLDLALAKLDTSRINMVEVIMDKMDCPWRFVKMTEKSRKH